MKIDLRQLPKARLDFVKPMLAKPVDQLPLGKDWIYELKLDGYRALVMKKRGVVTIFSRRGNKLNTKFSPIVRAFSFLPDETMIDGELVVLDGQGMPSFAALQHSQFTPDALHFYVFDLVAFEGKDLRKISLEDRRQLLEDRVLRRMRDPVRLSAVFDTTPDHLSQLLRKRDLREL